ncbi:MAG: amidase [Paracoccaceae bacterium]|nr:MAG: amidase [Paracoccaceae bacterium]
MTGLPDDPMEGQDIAGLAQAIRSGRTTAERVTRAYLDRIARLDPALGAYEHVAGDQAMATARAVDAAIAAGRDPGPLGGVPVAVKDLLAVDGMPTTGGSLVDVTGLCGAEGPFVRRLRATGAVILGKARTVEFAFGATGINLVQGTPWNPADAAVHRIPGGSSSGPAVAVAAGLAAFAIGSDTGGSVRNPAALCGIFGLKTTHGLWPLDGVVPLAPSFDSIGLLTRTAGDAGAVFVALQGAGLPATRDVSTLRLARPTGYAGPIDAEVSDAFETAVARLMQHGVTITEVAVPEAAERETIFPLTFAVELMERFGLARFEAERDRLDPVVATRLARAIGADMQAYHAGLARHKALVGIMQDRMAGLDGWVLPTTMITAPKVEDFTDPERGLQLTMGITRNTQPANLFGQCAVSLPLPGTKLPVGLQIVAAPGRDADLMAMACAVERVIGRPPLPDVRAFAR